MSGGDWDGKFTTSEQAYAAMVRTLPVTSAQRINYEWARMNWLRPKIPPRVTCLDAGPLGVFYIIDEASSLPRSTR